MHLPTVKIKRDNDRGFRIINESAFDPKIHDRFDDDAAPAKAPRKKAAKAEVAQE